jgi:hypothetical protein
MTCGTDENLYIWDGEKKHRSMHLKIPGGNISAASVNLDGSAMVIALGYDWHRGIWGMSENITPELYVHLLTPANLISNSR